MNLVENANLNDVDADPKSWEYKTPIQKTYKSVVVGQISDVESGKSDQKREVSQELENHFGHFRGDQDLNEARYYLEKQEVELFFAVEPSNIVCVRRLVLNEHVHIQVAKYHQERDSSEAKE